MNNTMFCPKCGSIMIPKKNEKKTYLVCPNCGYIDKKNKAVLEEAGESDKEKIAVIDEKDTVAAALPKVKIECPKCHNNEAYFWTVQTRAADEAETKFYRCTKCNYTWRDYS